MVERERFGDIEVLHKPTSSFYISEEDVDALEQKGHCVISRHGDAAVGELLSLRCGRRMFVARVESVVPGENRMIKVGFELIRELIPLPENSNAEQELEAEIDDHSGAFHTMCARTLRGLRLPEGITITVGDYPRIMNYETLINDLSHTLFFLSEPERRKIAMKVGVIADPAERATLLKEIVDRFLKEANALYFNGKEIPSYYTKDNELVKLVQGIRSGEVIVPKDFFDLKIDG